MRILLTIPLILLLVPTWSGDERLPLYRGVPDVVFERVALDRGNPGRRRVGALTYLGGVRFTSGDPAFGGFSAMTLRGDRFLLLSDGGLRFSFAMGAELRPHDLGFGALTDGPGTGWRKDDRDSESLAVDPASGASWVGFERANAIWRYAPGFARAVRRRAPPEMASWPDNSGPEAMARLPGGRFVILSENARARGGGKRALLFDRDPTDHRARATPFRLLPPDGYRPTDAAMLPDGRVLVLARRLSVAGRGFTAVLLLLDPAAIRAGAAIRPRVLAHFAQPLLHDNFEGLAVGSERGATIVWIVSDDNAPSLFQRTLLLKFRLEGGQGKQNAAAADRPGRR